MIQLIALYLLAGTIVGFFLEKVVRATDQDVNGYERFNLIVFWPFMALIFIVSFIKSMFE